MVEQLHSMGPKMVVITTLDVNDATDGGVKVAMMLSEMGRPKYLLRLPFIEGGPFCGTGDLTAAMILAWTALHPHEPALALEKTGAVLQSVIARTVALRSKRDFNGLMVPPELCIVESKRNIEQPHIAVRCCQQDPMGCTAVIIEGSLPCSFIDLDVDLDISQRMAHHLHVPVLQIEEGLASPEAVVRKCEVLGKTPAEVLVVAASLELATAAKTAGAWAVAAIGNGRQCSPELVAAVDFVSSSALSLGRHFDSCHCKLYKVSE